MTINDEAAGQCFPAFVGDDDGAAESATSVEDLPADVLSLVLGRLDGASLAALGCACAAFRDLATDPVIWRALCLTLWPSLRDVPPCSDGDVKAHHHHYRRLFADAFPFPAVPLARAPAPAGAAPLSGGNSSLQLPARLVSAVDLRHGGACVMSRAVETDASSAWFLGAPFRVDALAQEGFTLPPPAATPIHPAELELSWVLIDPDSGRAVNASSRRPVSVDRRWLTGETVVRFAFVLGGVALDAAVTCDERYGHVREVSLCMEDAEGGGGGVSGRDGLAVVAAAMAGERRGRGGEEEAKARYQEFVKGRADRKERKARREGIIDLCCSGVGAAAFLGFLVMLTAYIPLTDVKL